MVHGVDDAFATARVQGEGTSGIVGNGTSIGLEVVSNMDLSSVFRNSVKETYRWRSTAGIPVARADQEALTSTTHREDIYLYGSVRTLILDD